MRFREILGRINGFSTPVAGISWNPPEAETTVARRVLTYLEDRRVLYANYSWEIPDECVHSIIELRAYLTAELQQLRAPNELAGHLRALRAACRRFLSPDDEDGNVRRHRWHTGRFGFELALGELRATFGLHIAAIAAKYGLDVEDGLSSILPPQDDDADHLGDEG